MGRAEDGKGRGSLQAVELVEIGELRKKASVNEEDYLKREDSGASSKDGQSSRKDFRSEDVERINYDGSEEAVQMEGEKVSRRNVNTGSLLDKEKKDAKPMENNDMDWQRRAEQEEAVRLVLSEQEVDIEALRQVVWEGGLPEGKLRASAWRVLCGYVGEVRSQWEETLVKKREEYWEKVDRLMTRPGVSSSQGDSVEEKIDHPLSVAEDSGWNSYFRDGELRDEIGKDVDRTHPGHEMFEKQKGLQEALARILFVWTKEKGGPLGYRQGMHELAALVLLVFANGSLTGQDYGHVEADTYWCFEYVMENARTCYLEKGITTEMGRLGALLKIKDPELEAYLRKSEVDVRFWGLRWMRLWLVREFSVSRAIQVWDILLCAEDVLSWLRYLCVAICIMWRDRLLARDFGKCVKMLLGGVDLDISKIVKVADQLRKSNVVYSALVNKGPPPTKDKDPF